MCSAWRQELHPDGSSCCCGWRPAAAGPLLASIDEAWLFPIAAALTITVVLFLSSMITHSPLASVRGWLQRACFGFLVLWLVAASLMPD